MMMYMKIRWRPLQVHNISNISNIYNIICNNNNNNNNKHMKVYMLLDFRRREWKHNVLL